MDPLSITASIVAVLQLSSKVLGYLNDVQDASKDRAKCAVEASNLNNLLVNLRFRLEGSSNESWYTAVRALGVDNGPLDQFKQALDHLQTKMTGGGRLKKVGRTLTWKLSKEEVASILARMERLKPLVQIALQMDHFKLCQAIKECTDTTRSNTDAVRHDTGFIRTYVSSIESRVDAIQQDQDRTRHEKLMAWISPTDFPAQQSDFIARRQEGTGQWFVDAPEFSKWLHEPNQTLFCPGICGAGKTMITAIVIDRLLKAVWSGSVGVAYVYCNYKAHTDQNAAGLLAGILKQLVQAQPSFAEPVVALHKQHADRGTKASLEEIFRALQSVLANYSSVYIAVDALDECPSRDGTRRQFLAKLRDLQGGTDVRLMVTSRFIPDVLKMFSTALMLEVRASDWDVKRFVAGQTHRLPICIQRDNTLQDMVQEKIAKAVDGMFLLARLHVDSLLDKRTKKRVQYTLDTLSKGSEALGKAYDDVMERVNGQLPHDSALAINVLSWIVHAKRPLTTEEIAHALAVQPEDEELDMDNMFDVEDIVSVCAGLVVVDEESDIIRLVHHTTQEYFEQAREDWNHVQLMIASTCLTYLSFGVFRSGSCSTEEDFESRLVQNPFLDYAARYWGIHTLTVQEEVCNIACSFLRRSSSVSCAMQAMSIRTKNGDYLRWYRKEGTGLHLTAQFGLLSLSEELLSSAERDATFIDSRDSLGQTSLLLAAEYGHDAVAKLLLDKGAEVNAQCNDYGYCNALQAASCRGHTQMVKLLLEEGAEVNAQGGVVWGNALEPASFGGHKEIVELLLDKGAEANAQGQEYCNALHAASVQGHNEIVKLLLDKGAETNGSGDFSIALGTASAQGYKQIVKLLLDNGAKVNAQHESFGTVRQVASSAGHEAIVKLLLDKGAEVNAKAGDYYGNALYAASAEGHDKIVKLLHDNGAEVNARNAGCYNVIEIASAKGHEKVVKLLLDTGTEIEMQDGFYDKPLKAASAEGHEQIVKLLLEKGAEADQQERHRYSSQCIGSALYGASDGGHEQIVKLLLDHGTKINAQGGDYGNPLEAASAGGHEEIVKVLLGKGAEVDAQAEYYGVALEAASDSGHEQIVQLLLDHYKEFNAQDGDHTRHFKQLS